MARYSEGHVILWKKKPDMYMLNIFIGYIRTNTNIGPLTKLFLWFRLVISTLALGLETFSKLNTQFR
ncbi:hypothetical protein Hanom_Chr13g01194441 [Helianthus anomalus]